MAGNYLLDTNIFIYAINQGLRLPEQTYTASVITAMELLSWPGLGDPTAIQMDCILVSNDEKLVARHTGKVLSLDEFVKLDPDRQL